MGFTTDKDAILKHSVLGEFSGRSGGDSSIEFTEEKTRYGGDDVAFQGKTTRDAITLTRHYDPVIDDVFIRRHAAGDPLEGSFTETPMDADGVPIPGTAKTYAACKVTKITVPGRDINSSTPSKISYEMRWTKVL